MKLTGVSQSFSPGALRILRYHRIALGLETGTRVYLAALPPDIDGGRVSEVLLTTIAPKDWGRLYRISMTLIERQGIVAEVLQILSERNININILETLTTENAKRHELLAIVTTNDPKPNQLANFLKEELRGKLFANSKPLVLPLARLKDAYRKRSEAKRIEDEIDTSIHHGSITLGLDEWRMLLRIRNDKDIEKYSRVLMFSDTEERYLLLYFPSNDECLLRITVKHSDTPGALSAFTDHVAAIDANIINSYSRILKSGESAEWRATLDVSQAKSCWELLSKIRQTSKYYQDYLQLAVHSHSVPKPRRPTTIRYSHEGVLKNLDMFFGRDEYVTSIINDPKHYLISGYYKTGKSSLLRKIAQDLNEGAQRIPIEVDMQGIAPADFFRVVIRTIWNKLSDTLALPISEIPTPLKPFLPSMFNGGKIVATPPGTPHKLDSAPSIVDLRIQYVNAFACLVNLVTTRGLSGIVILVDETQSILYCRDNGCTELRAIWGHLNESGSTEQLQWVVADSEHWRSNTHGASGVTSKMSVLLMRQLSPDAAQKLVEEPFAQANIHPATLQVTKKILSFSGRQPCYVQALCGNILKQFASLPNVVDIITEDMVEEATRGTVDALHLHFKNMYAHLAEMLNAKTFARILSPKETYAAPREQLIRQDHLNDSLALSLESVPGLVRIHIKGSIRFKATEIFRYWAEKHGVR